MRFMQLNVSVGDTLGRSGEGLGMSDSLTNRLARFAGA